MQDYLQSLFSPDRASSRTDPLKRNAKLGIVACYCAFGLLILGVMSYTGTTSGCISHRVGPLCFVLGVMPSLLIENASLILVSSGVSGAIGVGFFMKKGSERKPVSP